MRQHDAGPDSWEKTVQILINEQVGPVYFKMRLAFPEVAGTARPGQFVMVRPFRGVFPLLRRPLSVHDCIDHAGRGESFEILYKVVGKATRALSLMKPGEHLDVLGPLGQGFSWSDPDLERDQEIWLVAGGVGVASLHFLARRLLAPVGRDSSRRVLIFLGGCCATDILCRESLESMGAEVLVATEDGSQGEKGLVTSLVEKAVGLRGNPDLICACGPEGMLKVVSALALAYPVACQVSLETFMACGFGACLGCAVETAISPKTYLHACTDGPVFDARQVSFPAYVETAHPSHGCACDE